MYLVKTCDYDGCIQGYTINERLFATEKAADAFIKKEFKPEWRIVDYDDLPHGWRWPSDCPKDKLYFISSHSYHKILYKKPIAVEK